MLPSDPNGHNRNVELVESKTPRKEKPEQMDPSNVPGVTSPGGPSNRKVAPSLQGSRILARSLKIPAQKSIPSPVSGEEFLKAEVPEPIGLPSSSQISQPNVQKPLKCNGLARPANTLSVDTNVGVGEKTTFECKSG
eukprot:263403_1